MCLHVKNRQTTAGGRRISGRPTVPWWAPPTNTYMTLKAGCASAVTSLYISAMPTILGESPIVALYLQPRAAHQPGVTKEARP